MSLFNELVMLDSVAGLLLQLMFAATVLLPGCYILILVAGRRSAAVKHRIWCLGLVALIPFQFIAPLLPQLGVNRWSLPAEERVRDAPLVTTTTATEQVNQLVDAGVDVPDRPDIAIHDKQPLLTDENRVEISGTERLDFESPQDAGDVQYEHGSYSEVSPVPEAAQQADQQPAWSWSLFGRLCAAVWFLGVAIGLLRFLANQLAVQRLVRRAAEVQSGEVLQIRNDVGARLGLMKLIPIRCTPEAPVPLATGIMSPCLLLPSGYGRWDQGRLVVSLAHELAHFVRRDVLWQALVQLVCCFYWPHPFVWLAGWRTRVEREHACDDAVLAIGASATEYATHLVDLASALTVAHQPVKAAVAIITRSEVENRVRAILNSGLRRGPVSKRLGICLLVVTLLEMTAAGVLRPSLAHDPLRSETTESAISDQTEVASPLIEASPLNVPFNADKVDQNRVVAVVLQEDVKQAQSQGGTTLQGTATGSQSAQTQLRGIVVDEADQPVAGLPVIAELYRTTVSTMTDAAGKFVMTVSTEQIRRLKLQTGTDAAQRMAFLNLTSYRKSPLPESMTLKLVPTYQAEVQVNDINGRPVEGAHVGMMINQGDLILRQQTNAQGKATLRLPLGCSVQTVHAWKSGLGLSYHAFSDPQEPGTPQSLPPSVLPQPVVLALKGARPVSVTLLDAATNLPITNTPVYPWLLGQQPDLNLTFFNGEFDVTTDSMGVAKFDWIPKWSTFRPITFWAVNPDYPHQRGELQGYNETGNLTMRLQKLVPIRGTVRFPDGKPAPGIRLFIKGDGYGPDDFSGTVTTDELGKYEIKAAADQLYLIMVRDRKWATEPATGFALKPGVPKENLDFELRPATRLFGQVRMGAPLDPVRRQYISLTQYGKGTTSLPEGILPNPTHAIEGVQPEFQDGSTLDKDGNYEFFVGPGLYVLDGSHEIPVKGVEIRNESELEINFDPPRPGERRLQATVYAGERKQYSVDTAHIWGVYRHESSLPDLHVSTDRQGQIDIARKLHPLVLYARSDDASVAGIVENIPDQQNVGIHLRPVVTATGRVIEESTRVPRPDSVIDYGISISLGEADDAPHRLAFGGTVTCDSKGEFRIKYLVAGQTYYLKLVTGRDRAGHANRWESIGTVNPRQAGSEIDLGDLEFGKANRPSALAERIAAVYRTKVPAVERYQNGVRTIRQDHLRLLLMFSDPKSAVTEQFYKLRFEDEAARSTMDGYRLVALSNSGDGAAAAMSLADRLKIQPRPEKDLELIIIDEQENQLVRADMGTFSKNGTIDKDLLLAFLKQHSAAPKDARVRLNAIRSTFFASSVTEAKDVVRKLSTRLGRAPTLDEFADAIPKDKSFLTPVAWQALKETQNPSVTFDEFIERSVALRDAISRIDCTVECYSQNFSPGAGERKLEKRCRYAHGGGIYYQSEEEIGPDGEVKSFNRSGYDGDVYRQYRQLNMEREPVGGILKLTSKQVFFPSHSHPLSCSMLLDSVSVLGRRFTPFDLPRWIGDLKDSAIVFEAPEIIDGRKCLVISTGAIKCIVDVEHGGVLRRLEKYTIETDEAGTRGKRQLESRRMIDELANFGSGIWLPQQIRDETYDKGTLTNCKSLSITWNSVNGEIPMRLAVNVIKKGARVLDSVTGKIYRQGIPNSFE